MGLGRCSKVILQTCALENFHSCRWGAERMVPCAQTRERAGIYTFYQLIFRYEALVFMLTLSNICSTWSGQTGIGIPQNIFW